MLIKYKYEYLTPSSRIHVNNHLLVCSVKELNNYCYKEKFDGMCKVGCKNYAQKWSCPPFSPNYQIYTEGFKNICMVVSYIKLSEFNYIKHDYLKIKAANSILKSRCDKLLRNLASKYGGKLISTGSCRLCKPCRFKLGEHCSKSGKMGYSYEALGIDVSTLSKDFLGHELLWYKKGCLPNYTSVVTGFVYNGAFNIEMELESLSK